jgi:dihydrofolate reductase
VPTSGPTCSTNQQLAGGQPDRTIEQEAGNGTDRRSGVPLRSGDPFTDKMNSMPKFVASATLQEPLEWNATLLKGDVAQQVQELKQQPGHSLLIYGSGALVDTLRQHNLVDVYRLMVHPLVLAAGKRLFSEGAKTTLTLTDAKTTGTGVVVLTYQPAATESEGSAPNEQG